MQDEKKLKTDPKDSAPAKFIETGVNIEGLGSKPHPEERKKEEKKSIAEKKDPAIIEAKKKIAKFVDDLVEMYGLKKDGDARTSLIEIIKEYPERRADLVFTLDEKEYIEKYLQYLIFKNLQNSTLKQEKIIDAVWIIFIMGATRQKMIDQNSCLDCKCTDCAYEDEED